MEHILAAIIIGIKGVFNPFAIAGILIYLFFVHQYCPDRKSVHISGVFLASTLSLIYFFHVGGAFDGVLLIKGRSMFVGAMAFVLSLFVFAVGIVHLLDWRRLGASFREPAIWLKLPGFLKEKSAQGHHFFGETKARNLVVTLLFSVILGCAVGLANLLWPDEYELFARFYTLIARGALVKAQSLFVLSAVAYGAVMLSIPFLYPVLVSQKAVLNFMIKNFRMIKVVLSSVYLSVACSLFFILSTYVNF